MKEHRRLHKVETTLSNKSNKMNSRRTRETPTRQLQLARQLHPDRLDQAQDPTTEAAEPAAIPTTVAPAATMDLVVALAAAAAVPAATTALVQHSPPLLHPLNRRNYSK